MASGRDVALKATAPLHGPADGQAEPGSQRSSSQAAGEAQGRAGSARVSKRWGFPNDYRLLAVHKDPGESGSLNTHLELGQMKINY